MLEEHGHQVIRYELHNDQVKGMGRLELARRTFWSRTSYAEIRHLAAEADVAHFHNTLPLISPAGYYAAQNAGVPVVQTLHNFRLVCVQPMLYRDGGPCQDCVGRRMAWPAVKHKCYRDSAVESAAVVAVREAHRLAGTWHRAIDRYIVLSEFMKDIMTRHGYPAERMTVRHNALFRGLEAGRGERDQIVFAGRLVGDKGVLTLLEAWKRYPDLPRLVICGDGPLADEVSAAAAADPRIDWLGWRDRGELDQLLADSRLAIVPSLNYEGWPLTIIEAFAAGTPVVASRLGAIPEIFKDPAAGMLFAPGEADSLAEAVRRTFAESAPGSPRRSAARRLFKDHYSAETAYKGLLDVYSSAGAVSRLETRS